MGVHNAELYNNLGLCCFYAQQYDMALTCMERALSLSEETETVADVWSIENLNNEHYANQEKMDMFEGKNKTNITRPISSILQLIIEATYYIYP